VERKHLSDAELARGVRLACQCFPRSDGEDCSILVLERAADRTRAL
jgi:ferredoxin